MKNVPVGIGRGNNKQRNQFKKGSSREISSFPLARKKVRKIKSKTEAKRIEEKSGILKYAQDRIRSPWL